MKNRRRKILITAALALSAITASLMPTQKSVAQTEIRWGCYYTGSYWSVCYTPEANVIACMPLQGTWCYTVPAS